MVGSMERIRRQRPLKGGRDIVVQGLDPRIESAIEKMAARFACTRQLVIATALADQFGIDLDVEDRYR